MKRIRLSVLFERKTMDSNEISTMTYQTEKTDTSNLSLWMEKNVNFFHDFAINEIHNFPSLHSRKSQIYENIWISYTYSWQYKSYEVWVLDEIRLQKVSVPFIVLV